MTVYTSSTCSKCPSLKKWLAYKGYSYEEKNIEDPKNHKELLHKAGVSTVPVTIINDRPYIGLDFKGIAEAMNA